MALIFGERSIAPEISGVHFPEAKPLVMSAERTIWEKATAAHVFCLQGRLRGQRYSRHWFDLAAIGKTPHFEAASTDAGLAEDVARHKSIFLSKKMLTAPKVIISQQLRVS